MGVLQGRREARSEDLGYTRSRERKFRRRRCAARAPQQPAGLCQRSTHPRRVILRLTGAERIGLSGATADELEALIYRYRTDAGTLEFIWLLMAVGLPR